MRPVYFPIIYETLAHPNKGTNKVFISIHLLGNPTNGATVVKAFSLGHVA